jgi:hypothetical protein
VHPELVTSYLDGDFVLKIKSENKLRDGFSGLKPVEAAVLALLQSRIGHGTSGHGTSRDMASAARNARQTKINAQVRT